MTRTKKAIDTKEHIRECAIELFKKADYKDVTFLQICEAAGITKRTFYYHFESKSDIIFDLMDDLGKKAEGILEIAALQQSNVKTLWALMSVYSIGASKYGPKIMQQYYIHLLEGSDADFPYSAYLYNTAVEVVALAQNTGEIPDYDTPENITYLLYHSFRSVGITWASQGGKTDLIEDFRRVFAITLHIDSHSF